METYKGIGGSQLTIDGENVNLKFAFIKESCTFSDITKVEFKQPSTLMNGNISIYTKKQKATPYQLIFPKKRAAEFEALYELLLSRVSEASKNAGEDEPALQTYSAQYLGGEDNNPKKAFIFLEICKNSFEIKSQFPGDFKDFSIPYDIITNFEIVPRTVSTVEGLLGGINSRQLNQDNNIHITYTNDAGEERIVRIEMVTGTTVMGQAGKCRELVDFLRVNNILSRIEKRAQSTAEKPEKKDDYIEELQKLAQLKDAGIISQDEFDAKKKEILGL